MNQIEKKYSRFYFTLLGAVYTTFFFYTLSAKLVDGGRWSTGMFLGGVDNWLQGGTLYSVPTQDCFAPIGPIYSPGGAVLALFARLLFGYHAEAALIIMGGIMVILMLWGFAVLIAPVIKVAIFFIGLTFFFLCFPYLRSYSYEIHPDVPALMFFVWGVIFVGRVVEGQKKWTYVIAIVLFTFSGLFKATAVFLFLGLGVYTLLTKRLSLKDKVFILASEAISGLMVLAITFSLKGCWYNSIEVMGYHPMVNSHAYLSFIYDSLKHNFIFVALVCYALFLLYKRKINYKSLAEEMWFCSSGLWFAFGIYGLAKLGSNAGNVDASLIALTPLAMYGLVYIYDKINSNSILNALPRWNDKAIRLMCLVCSIAVILLGTALSYRNFTRFKMRIESQNTFSEWLNNNYRGQNIAFWAGGYELLNNTSLNKKSDLHILGHYMLGDIISKQDIVEISRHEGWDIIIVIPSLMTNLKSDGFDGFKKLELSMYPNVKGSGEVVNIYVKERE